MPCVRAQRADIPSVWGPEGSQRRTSIGESLQFGEVWFFEAGGQTEGKWIPGAGSSSLHNGWEAGQGWAWGAGQAGA